MDGPHPPTMPPPDLPRVGGGASPPDLPRHGRGASPPNLPGLKGGASPNAGREDGGAALASAGGLRSQSSALCRVTIVEVGPRDGLQNDTGTYPTDAKVAFIEALAAAGAPIVETTSFVSPSAIPKLADAEEVMRRLTRRPGVRYLALVPNERGYERARAAGVDAVALFASATEAFSQANLRASIAESFARFAPVARRATADGVWLRGYVSVAVACPYSGPTDSNQARDVAARLAALGCDQIALADTIGVGQPADIRSLLEAILPVIPADRLALHLHDTHGAALANVDAALDHGVTVFDSAAGGLGGCPYAPGSPGNLATEHLVEHLHRQGIATGLDALAVHQAVVELWMQRLDGTSLEPR